MKTIRIFSFLLLFILISCKKETNNDNNDLKEKYVSTDVLVKTKGYFTIDKVFDFINSFDHDVEYIDCGVFNSNLPSDSLQYVLDYLNAKTYTKSKDARFMTGYLHYQTQQITIFPKLYTIKNKSYQADWLQSMVILQLTEQTDKETNGTLIFFHVPEGKEKEWVAKFKAYDFVEWAELNYVVDLNPWP
jgi:hypothetical protein